jgi:hypothetical protein
MCVRQLSVRRLISLRFRVNPLRLALGRGPGHERSHTWRGLSPTLRTGNTPSIIFYVHQPSVNTTSVITRLIALRSRFYVVYNIFAGFAVVEWSNYVFSLNYVELYFH